MESAAGLHVWSVQVPGNGWVETRRNTYDANGRLVDAAIFVDWNDGTHFAQATRFFPNGEVQTEGTVRYPDDTHLTTHFYPNGGWEVVHHRSATTEFQSWHYDRDGSAHVEATRPYTDSEKHGTVRTVWDVGANGHHFGDFNCWEAFTHNDGQSSLIHTKGTPDGTWTIKSQLWNAQGGLVNETTTIRPPQPSPKPAVPESTTPTLPTPGPVTDASPVDIITGTSRLPIPVLPVGPGWGGPVPTLVEHIEDWWLQKGNHVTYLGSTVTVKKE